MTTRKQLKTEPATEAAGNMDSYSRFNHAKALHEEMKAKRAEIAYKNECGLYLIREDVRKSAAVILANLAQTMRNLPDYLERKAGIEPAVVLAIQEAVDNALAEVAESLRKIHEG